MIDEQTFREEIMREMGWEKLSSERQDALLDKTIAVLLERIFLTTLERLGEAGVREYEKLLEQEASAAEMEAFLESRISGYNEFVQKIVAVFKTELKSAGENNQ